MSYFIAHRPINTNSAYFVVDTAENLKYLSEHDLVPESHTNHPVIKTLEEANAILTTLRKKFPSNDFILKKWKKEN